MAQRPRQPAAEPSVEPAGYPVQWESDVVLADGLIVQLRPIRPEDADALAAMHRRLSPESVYFRYFTPQRELAPSWLRHFTQVDYRSRMSFVATFGDTVIAFASYDQNADGEAEVSFAVEDEHQGRGLGTLLLEHLAGYAREQGLRRFSADVLPMNRPMLSVFRDAGFRVDSEFDEGVVHVVFRIDPTRASRAAAGERERNAEAHSVARVLEPKTIAVVGAGRSPRSIGHAVLRNLQDGGFRGPLYPVNPNAAAVRGLPAYPHVGALPGPIDLAVVAVPAAQVLDVARACAGQGATALVVVSAGFAETGDEGAKAERELVALARHHGMRVIGPNCLGIANTAPEVRMNATFAAHGPAPGRVGLLSQSGALGIALLERTRQLGLGISSFASVGNKADVSGNDFLQYWEQDPRTDVVLLYLESFGNPAKFSRVARRVSRHKPIVALKSGRSAAGSRAAASHTAALASADRVVDALFAQTGVIRVDGLDQLLDVAQLLVHQPLPEGKRVAVVGNSGGPGILAVDACENAGLVVPELSPHTQSELRTFLPPGAALSNPVDLVASAGPEEFERGLGVVLADDKVDAAIVIFTPTLTTPIEGVAEAIARVAGNGNGNGKTLVANFVGVEPPPRALLEKGRSLADGTKLAHTVPIFPFPESAARALARAATYAAWRSRTPGRIARLAGVNSRRARRLVDDALASDRRGSWLDAEQAGLLLHHYGIPVAETTHAADVDDAIRIAAQRRGPVALKAANPRLVHKSDVGGVALGLEDEREVREAWADMQARLGAEMGGADVQTMAPPGLETIVGVVQDPSFGPLLLFGVGGFAAELTRDQVFRILPLTDADAHRLVRSLRSSPLLFGYRGSPPCDVAALEDLLLRVSRLVEDLPEIDEMDLNPVIVSERGVQVVDAKLRVAAREAHPELGVRRMV